MRIIHRHSWVIGWPWWPSIPLCYESCRLCGRVRRWWHLW